MAIERIRPALAYVNNDAVMDGANIARAKLAQNALQPFAVPFETLRVWDSYETVLPGTSASDDLGLYGGTWATGSQLVRTYDIKTLTTALYARFRFTMPPEYDAGETITVRFHSGMVTTAADTSCTLDLVAYLANDEGGIGSDLCATAAQSINSLTYADKDFTITPSGIVAGDTFDCRIHVASTDAATGTAVIASIGAIWFMLDIKG